ncbi:TPA: hypothetical protein N0F65_006230 [Lagenidium giganteum]|uniref:Uncharacterized protein n=1 Tax=Lagenidium giganteum TaxID=4803 RepID=A0AAV2Z4G6_9STRA|nr:TPA: hypothetical protein N0F65_006230 [Lagenidium giganteum]
MEELRKQLEQLSRDDVKKLLDAAGHGLLTAASTALAECDEKQRVQRAADKKQIGNDHFKGGQWQQAVEAYSESIELDATNALTWSNRAAAHLKLNNLSAALEDCTQSIALAPSVKSFMRRATAYARLHCFQDAMQDLKCVFASEPRNKQSLSLLEEIVATLQQQLCAPECDLSLRSTLVQAELLLASRAGWTRIAVRGNPAPPGLNGHVLFRAKWRDGSSRVMLFGGRAVRDQKSDVLIVFGGNGQRSEQKMNEVWAFDLASQAWSHVVSTGDVPAPRSYHTAHMMGGFMIVLGGRMVDREDDQVYVFDLEVGVWYVLPIPEDRRLSARAWHSSVALDDGRLFLLGGGTYTGPLKDAALLDLSTLLRRQELMGK